MPVPPWVPDYETTPLGHFGHPSNEQPDVFFFAAWPVSGAPGGELWPTDNPERMPVIAGNRIGTGQAFIIGDSAFGLNKNFTLDDYAIGSNRNIESLSPNPSFWRSQLQTWLGHSAEKPRNVESRTGGIINLPTPKAEKGATP
jgi:hypothetical protein